MSEIRPKVIEKIGPGRFRVTVPVSNEEAKTAGALLIQRRQQATGYRQNIADNWDGMTATQKMATVKQFMLVMIDVVEAILTVLIWLADKQFQEK